MNPQTAHDLVHAIQLYLNPQIFQHEESLAKIRTALAEESLVVIRNAAREAFAEMMFHCLDKFSDWRVYEKYEENFHFHTHNIYDPALFPPELQSCLSIFSSEPTRSFMSKLSQRDCTGQPILSASLYLPGDHALPHNDLDTEDGL